MKHIIFVILINSINLFPQHLPLQIGNQWHYDKGLGLMESYAAFAVDTQQINNKLYFKIECKDANADSIVKITYDRIEGDSLYFRWTNGVERLLWNFNLQDSQVFIEPSTDDTACFNIAISHRVPCTFWGIHTEYSYANSGLYCPAISPDTGWVLGGSTYLIYFGCLDCADGLLRGAVINGATYGTLHPLPVELITFTANLNGNIVNLKWETATEVNNRGFGLYRKNSEPNSNFSLVKFIPGMGTTTEKQVYIYNDEILFKGSLFYRLIQYDFDGTYKIIGNIKVNMNEIPSRLILDQNYPNPFNPTTIITYQIPKAQEVTIKVFDCLGKEIETLVNEFQVEGFHNVKFDASNLTSGIYFYQLKTVDFISTKKMIVIQ